MAQFYYSNQTDPSEYNQNYDFVPQDYEPSFYNIFDYNPKPYYNNINNINYVQQITTTAYSTFTPTEPKSVQFGYYHEPTSHHIVPVTDGAYYSQTTAAAAVTKTTTDDFNSPDFDEYDPTPYGGGYDIVQTYGRPLPPSDQTCYSLSGGSTTSKAPSPPSPPPQPVVPPPPQVVPPPVERKEEEEEVVSQIPSGYGLEAMDLLGNFFGYWPSYYYYARRGNDNENDCRFHDGGEGIGCGGCHHSGAADYLFGTLDPYVERRDGGGSFGQPIHCYDEHLREQALSIVHVDHHHDYHQFYDYHHQCDYQEDDDNSWSII